MIIGRYCSTLNERYRDQKRYMTDLKLYGKYTLKRAVPFRQHRIIYELQEH
jgi:hypothetical protein